MIRVRRSWQITRRSRRRNERGVALLIALLLLSLMSLMGLVLALGANSDMLINGYYGNYRGAFYAADSGLTVLRSQLINQISLNVNTTACADWGPMQAPPCNVAPLSATAATAAATVALNYLQTSYAGFTSLNTGQAGTSWPESFAIAGTSTCTNSFAPIANQPTATASQDPNRAGQFTAYKYVFAYNVCAIGRAGAVQQARTSETGTIAITIQANSNNQIPIPIPLSTFGLFINNYSPCFGPMAPGVTTGPTFTNGSFEFMDWWGSYTFTDPLTQQGANAYYWVGGNCIASPTTNYGDINPIYMGGFKLGQPAAPLPPDSYSQAWAVLDSQGCGEGLNVCGNPTSPSPPAVTSANLNAALKDISGAAYPPGGASTGVYLPYSCASGPCTVNGGGIYVEGNAGILLSIGADAANNPTQTYTITTSDGTVTTITTDIAANTTTVSSGGNTKILHGVFQNRQGVSPGPATMLYVDGNITGLSGPGQGQPSVQDGAQISIVAGQNPNTGTNGDINVTGDIIYKSEPVTLNTANSLIPGNDHNQVIGLFTATGNIILGTSYPNQNLQVDATLASIGSNCAPNSCGDLSSTYINTVTSGGQMQGNIFGASISNWNTYYDRRFTTRPGFGPPWFPDTMVSVADIYSASAPTVTATTQRLSWMASPQ